MTGSLDSISDDHHDLDDILELEAEPQRPDVDNSEEFDANVLLNQPLFDDSDGELSIQADSEEFDTIESLQVASSSTAPPVTNTSGSSPYTMPNGLSMQQQQQQQQVKSVVSSDSFHRMRDIPLSSSNHSPSHKHVNFDESVVSPMASPLPDGTNNLLFQQHNASPGRDQNDMMSLKVQEVQRQINQVQQRIQRVQLKTNNSTTLQQQDSFGSPTKQGHANVNVQALMDQASLNRSPPGRSISMPANRNNMEGFMAQQPMNMLQQQQSQMMGTMPGNMINMNMNAPQVQQQQQQNQAAMMGASQGSSGSSGRFSNTQSPNLGINMNQMQQQQHQQQQHSLMGTSQGSSGSGGSIPGRHGMQMHQFQNSMMMNNNNINTGNNNTFMSAQFDSMNNTMGFAHNNNMGTGNTMMNMGPQMNNMSSMNSGNFMNQGFSLDQSGQMRMNNINNPNMQVMNQRFQMENTEMGNQPLNNMQGFNQGFTLDTSDRSVMTLPAGFKPNQLDGSRHSIPGDMPGSMDMGSNMAMMLQQQQQQQQRQNSLPSTNSSSLAMMQGQPQETPKQMGSFDLGQMQRSLQQQGDNSGTAESTTGSEGGGLAMERLVEKMQRSAMSRNLVKQLSSNRSVSRTNSGRSISRHNSGRSISRHNSGRSVLRQNSSKTGRNLSRANSGRSIQRSTSGRAVDNGELPVRRMVQDPKHRLKDGPARGIVRHKSQSAALDGSNHKIVNIDGNSIGMI